ncbi:MAG: UvrD-helicase domain-containing protein [Candidatus Margulisiibacteriota bacterium]|jgi:DNA helicase-2/ATP-dependent DNA helicase PcrA
MEKSIQKNHRVKLNPEQQAAVLAVQGPVLIVAGAGTGKTRVLTERIEHLVTNCQVAADRILAVTFTNKAANELKSRLPGRFHYPWIGTFHSICNKILRIERATPFVIFDANDQVDLVKKICTNLEINIQFKPSTILSAISNAKNSLLTPATYANRISSFFEENVAKVFEAYQKELNANNALDFDDLLKAAVELLQGDPALMAKYQKQFEYILVDEYQDTNYAQYMLTKLLAEKHHNICVVGDSDQNIYSWRGANIENILNFEKDFPEAKVVMLEQNYRSTKTILHIANQVILKNLKRKPKNLWTDNLDGEPALIYRAYDSNDEANYLADLVVQQKKKNDVVILYRTNAQSRAIEDVFVKRSIPYRIIGGIKFYLRKEVKDVLAYVRYIYNNSDQLALDRIKKLPAYKKFAEEVKNISVDDAPGKIIEKVLAVTKYRDKLEKKATEEAVSRVENINELIGASIDFKNVGEFLAYVSLVADIDELEVEGEAVTMMTLHSAKGLEFPQVFITGCEEGLLPHYRSQIDPDMLEEERRLFYVGVTRAKEKVTLTLAKKRLIFGETWYNEPSRFLQDIPGSLAVTEDFETGSVHAQHKETLTPVSIYMTGEEVTHKRFGVGVIQSVNGDDLIIRFTGGDKILSAKYAPLEKA